MTSEREGDEALGEDELLETRRFRSCFVISLVAVACTLAFILSFFIEEDLRRIKYGDQESSERDSNKDDQTN